MTKYRFLLHSGLLLSLCFHVTDAQINNSVYSIFGVGELVENNIGMNRSMGGTGIAFQSGNSINYLNPASYLGVAPGSFTLEAGVYSVYDNSTKSKIVQKYKDIDFSYGSLGLFATDWWTISVGVLPFSHIGYHISSTVAIDGDMSFYQRTVKGSGSIKRVYIGNSFEITDGLALGLNVSYVGGSIRETETASGDNALATYELDNTLTLGSCYLDYGLQYTFADRDWVYTIGAIYGATTTLSSSDDLHVTANGTTTSLEHSERPVLKIPQKFGLGVAAKTAHFKAGFDFEWQNWAAVKFSNTLGHTRNSSRYSVGLEYKPARTAHGQESLSYRCGANYRRSYIEIGTTSIDACGVAVGMGMPFNRINLNVSVEYGEEGTLNRSLIKSRYWMLYASISLYEIWHPSRLDE
jgi:hypothetical protein